MIGRLDITPNDPDVMASKAGIYQAQGNLQEAASLLSEVNGQTRNEDTFFNKITQLRLERNYGEAIRMLQGRLDQFHFASQFEKAIDQVVLALMQRLAGDSAGSKVTVEQARDTLELIVQRSTRQRVFYDMVRSSSCCRGREGLGPKAGRACNYASAPCQRCNVRIWFRRKSGSNSDDRRRE